MDTRERLLQAIDDKLREFEGEEFYVVVLIGTPQGHDMVGSVRSTLGVNPSHVAEGMDRAKDYAMENIPGC